MDRRDFVKRGLVSCSGLVVPVPHVPMRNPKGVTTRPSPYPVPGTMDRLVAFLQVQGATLYARIDQQAEVQKAGQSIPPLEFILFGNPKAGGPVMALNPVAALDLPLKIIAWEDDQQRSWLAYNQADYIGERYALPGRLVTPFTLDDLVDRALER